MIFTIAFSFKLKNEKELNQLSTTELVRYCAQNTQNRCAWTEFCNRFDETIRRGIYRFKNMLVEHKNPDFRDKIIQDLNQEVYHQLLKNDCKALKAYRGSNENSFFLYLGVICKNTVLNYLRSKSNKIDRTPGHHEESEKAGASEESDTQIDLNIHFNLFSQGKHKARDRLILKLHFFDGLSFEEIAAAMNISTKRVANLIGLFKKYLKNQKD